jgi:hypothetical protein
MIIIVIALGVMLLVGIAVASQVGQLQVEGCLD